MFGFLSKEKQIIEVTNINSLYVETGLYLQEILSGVKNKFLRRKVPGKRCYVIDFDGDIMANQARALTFEVTSVIMSARPGDQVLIRLQSPGGAAHAYGYAASQIERLKKRGLKVIVAVDKIAASGGYMMACVADEIIAAPYAIIGSVGVVSEFPNFFGFLRSLGIEYKQYTAGKYKRTVSPMGEITEEGEKKFQEDLSEVYSLFKDHVARHRKNVDIEKVATGEHWQAIRAIDLGLVDEIKTAEEYIIENLLTFEFAKVTYVGDRKSFFEKVGVNLMTAFFDGALSAYQKMVINYKY